MWQELIEKLLARGMTEASIAAAAGTTQATINRLKRGRTKEPRHALGERLRALEAPRAAA